MAAIRSIGPKQRAPARGGFSCVVDSDPRFSEEVTRWFAVLTQVAQVHPRDLTVHFIGEPSPALLRLSRCGVRLAEVEPFDTTVPTCNKIAGALEVTKRPLEDDDILILSDTDVAITEDPRRLPIPQGAVGGKIVDGPNPGVAVLADVFAAAGLEAPRIVRTGCQANAVTVDGNFNGGLYVLRGRLAPRVASAWAAFARWLLDLDLFGPHRYFTDQVAMSLALRREGIRPWSLPSRWNYPVHVPQWIDATAAPPAAIHYHRCVAPSGQLHLTGVPAVDGVIAKANDAIRAYLEREEVLPCPGTCS
jgi:hypothetical protein